MKPKNFKQRKKGAGRHVQLPEYLQATEAWASLKPGPRALYIELKRRFNGSNNGNLVLSHRDAAKAINVHRNTISGYFCELQTRGLISMTQGPYLGPSGVGQAALWALQELQTVDGKPAQKGFKAWRKKQKPRTKTVHARHNDCDTCPENGSEAQKPVLKIVTGG